MELDPRRLRVLRAIALRGGVVDAARLLHLTPSAVSQQLVQLEREVGLSLVDRSGRRVTLTAPGRLLAARAERIEEELAEARRELVALTGEVSGTATIAAFHTAITHLVVPALHALGRSHPDLRPSVIDLEGPPALHELRTGAVDLVITEDDGGPEAFGEDGLAAATLLLEGYRIVVPASWSPPPESLPGLAGMPWVAGPPDSACGRALDRIAAEYGFVPQRAHCVLEYPGVLALVTAGFGAAILPTLALSGSTPDAVTVLPIPVPGHRRLMAVYRSARSGPEARTSVLIGALTDAAGRLDLFR